MIISDKNVASYKSAVSILPQPVQQALLGTAVRLTGTPVKGGTFAGSGVIVSVDSGTTTIVTAKHNLYIFGSTQDPPAYDDQLRIDFQNRVTINYGPALNFNATTTATANIATVTTITTDDTPSWLYDVATITSTCKNLATHAATSHASNLTENPAVLKVLTNPSLYLKKDKAQFFQTGFGNIRDKAANPPKKSLPTDKSTLGKTGNLQFRMSAPIAAATYDSYNQNEDRSGVFYKITNTIQLTADENSSTAPGDSGGGLFVYSVFNGTPQLLLIGVNSGGDMATTAKNWPPNGGPLVANNIATSLAHCYTAGLLSY